MNPFEMVVLIVLIVMAAKVLSGRNWHHRGRRHRDDESGALSGPEADAMRLEVARLKDRVETLERLATDRSRRLADEIDALNR